MSEPQIDIRPDHWAIVRDILQRHVPQYAVWAFGSRAKWTAKEFSDLDLAIITDSPLPLATSAALAEDFSESDLPWKVDIVDWAETSETFRKIIERDRVVVQEANSLLTQSLNTICSLIVDCPHSTPAWTDSGFIVLRNQNIKNGKLDLSSPSFTDETHFLGRNRRAKPSAGDIVITREAPMGEVCMIPNGLECCLGQRQVLLRPDPKIANSRYVLYALQSESVQHQIGWNEGTGSTVSNLRIPVLEALQIPMRSLKEQRAIAHILGTLDDRIELNRRMNETLEAMARSLFKSWFVDFDGVPAENMQESELGLIPNGWRVGKFEELLVLQRGFDLPTQARIAGQFPVIAAGGINGTHNEAMVKGPGVVTGRSGVLGNVYFELGDFWPLNTTLWVKEFRIAKPCYAYELLRGFDFKLFNSGSAVPTLNRNHIHHLPQIIPPAELINDFEKEAMTLRQRMDSNERESQALAQLRDTLLPKLISGEVRIKDAERLAETA
ncbi:restriction endonuclease subunit S [Ectopseudomonas mendocina]|uniref:restriction endonuclease subunit S n=1 Tax=Ectopseudomonas mendocina TaxID=300 RepID=UPI000E1B6EAE|nr:restriction endonuclease subunit S [Pseudomonas mendocina]